MTCNGHYILYFQRCTRVSINQAVDDFHVLTSHNTLQNLCLPFALSCVLLWFRIDHWTVTVYPKKYAHGFCFAVLCCVYTLTDFPISIRLTSLALWQSNDCPSASKATLMNMDKYFMWIHYERLHNHNKAKHNKTVCIFLGIYCIVCLNLAVKYESHWTDLIHTFAK